eukprot:2400113-Amphidinium_carterae.1
MVYDIAHAHRQVPVRAEDWRYLCFKLEGDPDSVFYHTVGTFGVSSAGFWWARVAAAVVRTLAYYTPMVWQLYQLLYVDDGFL